MIIVSLVQVGAASSKKIEACMHGFTEGLHACLSPQTPNDPTIPASWRRVAFVEEFFDIIKEIYCKEKGCTGSKKHPGHQFPLAGRQ